MNLLIILIVITVVLLGVVSFFILKNNEDIKDTLKSKFSEKHLIENNEVEDDKVPLFEEKEIKELFNTIKNEFTDEDGIIHTEYIDKESGVIRSYYKSNGEWYKYKYDDNGRFIGLKNHLGVDYIRRYNDEGQLYEYEDRAAGKHHTCTYDGNGRVASITDMITGITEWYSYNENGDVYLKRDSEGRCTYNISKMPKGWRLEDGVVVY